jgi:hypothetical protein
MRFNGFFHVGFFAHANSNCDHPVYTGQPVLDSYRFTKKEISSLWASLLLFLVFMWDFFLHMPIQFAITLYTQENCIGLVPIHKEGD